MWSLFCVKVWIEFLLSPEGIWYSNTSVTLINTCETNVYDFPKSCNNVANSINLRVPYHNMCRIKLLCHYIAISTVSSHGKSFNTERPKQTLQKNEHTICKYYETFAFQRMKPFAIKSWRRNFLSKAKMYEWPDRSQCTRKKVR